MSVCVTETFQENGSGSWGWRCSVCSVGRTGLESEDAAVRRHRSDRFVAAHEQALNAPDIQEALRRLRAERQERAASSLPAVLSIDWPARFRGAAEVAEKAAAEVVGAALLADRLRWAAWWASRPTTPSEVVEAIGRPLLGDAP
jgi:hypothetical protein